MPAPEIESCRCGRVVIDGQVHNKDSIILPDRVVGGWWCKEGHALHPDNLEVVFEAAPEVCVVGQGAYSRMQVTKETRQALQAAGIELVVLPAQKAVETYNAMHEGRAVTSALHLACRVDAACEWD